MDYVQNLNDTPGISLFGIIQDENSYILSVGPGPTEKDVRKLRNTMFQKINGNIEILDNLYKISFNNGEEMRTSAIKANMKAQNLFIIKSGDYFILLGTSMNNYSEECLKKAREIGEYFDSLKK